MDKGLIKLVLCFLLAFQFSLTPAMAQSPRTKGVTTSSGPRKQLATIIFSGLAGAILGLSTLSFYGRPQDHLSNMGVGLALGIIAGTTYTTWQAATRPREFYGSQLGRFDNADRRVWSEIELAQSASRLSPPKQVPVGMSYQWTF